MVQRIAMLCEYTREMRWASAMARGLFSFCFTISPTPVNRTDHAAASSRDHLTGTFSWWGQHASQ